MTQTLLPPVVAFAVTLLLGVLMYGAQVAGEKVTPFLGLVTSIALVVPLGVPVLWSWALFRGRPWLWVVGLFVITLSGLLALFSGDIGLHLASYAAVGLLAAFGLLSRWHPGWVLILMWGAMIPMVLISADLAELDEMFAEQKELTLQARRQILMDQQGEGAIPPTLAVEEEALDRMFGLLRLLAPGLVASGMLFQAALSFWVIWLLVCKLGMAERLRGFPAFGQWRFPFALIWLLAAGVGLMIAPRYIDVPGYIDVPVWSPLISTLALGPNLVLGMVGLAAVQGAAVQWHLSPVSMPLLARVILLFMAGFLFLPLVMLGLADQWLDLRKLDADDPQGRDDNGGNDDAPTDK